MSQQTFDFLCANRLRFPAELPQVRLTDYFGHPGNRNEFIFVGPRESAKTGWLTQNGWLREDGAVVGNDVYGYDADTSEEDLAAIGAKLTTMRRFRDTESISHPNYRPIVVMSDTNWWRVKSRSHASINMVANISFPQAAFYAALKQLSDIPIEAIYEVFGAKFLLAATDAQGRLLPRLAYMMLLESLARGGKVTTAKNKAQAAVAGAWLQTQKDLARWLIELVPSYKRLVDKQEVVSYPLKTIRSRLLSHAFRTGHTNRPWGLGVAEYMDYLEAAGVWRVTDKGYAHWGRPYSIGAAHLKLSLTSSAIDAMLQG